MCISSGWKISYIILSYKADDKLDIKNYSLISIINIFAKLFEKIMFVKLSNYLYQYINFQQHGAIPGLSTNTNWAVFSEHIMNAIKKIKGSGCLLRCGKSLWQSKPQITN